METSLTRDTPLRTLPINAELALTRDTPLRTLPINAELALTRDTPLRKLPINAERQLCLLLDPGGTWRKVAAEVPRRMGGKRFQIDEIHYIDDQYRATGRSPTKKILEAWCTDNAKIGALVSLMIKVELYREAEYLIKDVLKEPVFNPELQPVPDPEPVFPGPQTETVNLQNDANERAEEESDQTRKKLREIDSPTERRHPLNQDQGHIVQTEGGAATSGSQDSLTQLKRLAETNQESASEQRNEPLSNLSTSAVTVGKRVDDDFLDVSSWTAQKTPKVSSVGSSRVALGNSQSDAHGGSNETKLDDSAAGSEEGPSQQVHGTMEDLCSSETLCIRGSPTTVEPVRIFGDGTDALQVFPYRQLAMATRNFDKGSAADGGCLLGSGGFASVFLAEINETKVAVKRLSVQPEEDSIQNSLARQFETEVEHLSRFQHVNLLRMFGYCNDGPFCCIVYQYMAHGSLQDYLDPKHSMAVLSPQQRVVIAQGTARGINHLHTAFDIPLIHRDIKSANILLDEDFVAKVGDFGLCRAGPTDAQHTHVFTVEVMGTHGYVAPEYHLDMEISLRTDAYSYGVVLLELLTSLAPYDADRDDATLATYIIEREEGITGLIDSSAGQWAEQTSESMYQLALQFLQHKRKRPTISEKLPLIESWLC